MRGEQGSSMLHTDLWKAVAISLMVAVITGGASAWGTQQFMKADIQGIKSDVNRLQETVQQMQQDLYRPRTPREGMILEYDLRPADDDRDSGT